MLRRTFLSRVGPLICAFVVGAIVALWFLQDMLTRFDTATALNDRLSQRVESAEVAIDAARRLGPFGEYASPIRSAIADLDVAELRAVDPAIDSRVATLTALAPRVADADGPAVVAEMADQVHSIGIAVRDHAFDVQRVLAHRLRILVLALTIAALVMVNVAVYVLLRAAQLVLQPVAALVEGSRELATEHFDHRVDVHRNDEFGELARAYNHLAEELQKSEERKAEALRHLAVTLNHGLNNAMSIIEIQLGLLDRQTSGNPMLTKHLREIRTSLVHMAEIVASLRNIRRVVLAEYGPGEMMLDLERSVAVEFPDPGPRVEMKEIART